MAIITSAEEFVQLFGYIKIPRSSAAEMSRFVGKLLMSKQVLEFSNLKNADFDVTVATNSRVDVTPNVPWPVEIDRFMPSEFSFTKRRPGNSRPIGSFTLSGKVLAEAIQLSIESGAEAVLEGQEILKFVKVDRIKNVLDQSRTSIGDDTKCVGLFCSDRSGFRFDLVNYTNREVQTQTSDGFEARGSIDISLVSSAGLKEMIRAFVKNGGEKLTNAVVDSSNSTCMVVIDMDSIQDVLRL